MDNKFSKTVGQRINEMLALRDKKQKELAAVLNVTDNTVSYYCSGSRLPNTSQIKTIADFLECSADFLLGLTETPTVDTNVRAICDYTGLSEEAIKYLRYSVTTWQTDDTLSICNQFIEKGSFSLLIEAMSNYYDELKIATNDIGSVALKMKKLYDERDDSHVIEELFDERDVSHVFETFSFSGYTTDLKLYMFEMQNIPNEFMHKYSKQEYEEYQEEVDKLNNIKKIIYEHNIEVIAKEKERRKKAGEPHGNNQETQ